MTRVPQFCHPERSEGPRNRSDSEVLRFAQNDNLGRRSFLRLFLLIGLGAVAVLLGRRARYCVPTCAGCNRYARCSLPWKEAKR
jgi:hypothetical protein